MNVYEYCRSDPGYLTDPMGLESAPERIRASLGIVTREDRIREALREIRKQKLMAQLEVWETDGIEELYDQKIAKARNQLQMTKNQLAGEQMRIRWALEDHGSVSEETEKYAARREAYLRARIGAFRELIRHYEERKAEVLSGRSETTARYRDVLAELDDLERSLRRELDRSTRKAGAVAPAVMLGPKAACAAAGAVIIVVVVQPEAPRINVPRAYRETVTTVNNGVRKVQQTIRTIDHVIEYFYEGAEESAAQDAPKGGTRAGDLPAKGKPGSTDVVDRGGGKGTIRDYGPDGKAKTDYDFGHDHGAGDPHAHDWDWTKPKPRQPGRPLKPGE
jgi:hypothetical protein